METVLRAPFRARLKECPVSVGSQVEAGAPLLRLEPLGDDDAETAAGPSAADRRAGPARRARPRCRRASAAERGQEDLRGLLLGFDVDPHDERRVLDDYLAARRAATEDGHRPLAEELELVERVRRPGRAEPQPAGRRGRPARPRAQRPRVLPHLPAEPRRRAGRAAGARSRPGSPRRSATTASPTWSARPRSKPRCSGSSSPSSAPSADATVVAALLRAWLRRAAAGRRAARARRPGAGAADRRHPGPLPGRRRPGPRRGVRLVRPAAAAPQPRPGLRRGPQAPAPPGRAPGRARPRRADRRDGPQHRAAGPAARPAARPRPPRQHGHAGGADPALLRQQGRSPASAPSEVARLRVRGRRAAPASSVVSAAVELRRAGRRAARAGRAGRPARTPSTPTSTSAWENQPEDFDAMAAALHEVVAAHPLPRAGAPAHRHRRGPRRRGDAPPLHLPPVRRPGWSRTG